MRHLIIYKATVVDLDNGSQSLTDLSQYHPSLNPEFEGYHIIVGYKQINSRFIPNPIKSIESLEVYVPEHSSWEIKNVLIENALKMMHIFRKFGAKKDYEGFAAVDVAMTNQHNLYSASLAKWNLQNIPVMLRNILDFLDVEEVEVRGVPFFDF